MNENINLCEILKGHEGETFYNPLFGDDAILIRTANEPKDGYNNIVLKTIHSQRKIDFNKYGQYINGGECMIFPSKDQRDWNKWIEEQKPNVPKTWSELIYENDFKNCNVEIKKGFYSEDKTLCGNTPIEKSALALLKIHQLIEVGYGGNITNEEWEDTSTIKFVIDIYKYNIEFNFIITFYNYISHIAFHTKEQAEEFLKYPENIQLLKDYFMINE